MTATIVNLSLLTALWFTTFCHGKVGLPNEYCQEDYYDTQCADNQVILMKFADYGRMRIGKCVKDNYGHLGCSSDVTPVMNALCSGRQKCRFQVFDYDNRLSSSQCPDDIESYLQASHTCQEVVTAGASQCELQGRLPVTATTGFLSSLQTESKGLGTRSCPWILKAKTGQRLALSLLYFNPLGDDPSLKQGCGYQLAEVIDGGDTVTVSTCDGQDSSRPYYVSKTNQLTIQLVSRATLEMLGKFLISYQALGCEDPSIPANATLRRSGDNATVKCTGTERTWYLACQTGKWVGSLGNCSSPSEYPESSRQWDLFEKDGFPYGILIVVAIGVALGVFCGGLLLSIAAMYMKRRHPTSSRSTVVMTDEDQFGPGDLPYPDLGAEDTLQNDKNMAYQLHRASCIDDCAQQKQPQCTEGAKDTSTYGRTRTIQSGHGTYPTRSHVYEQPRFV